MSNGSGEGTLFALKGLLDEKMGRNYDMFNLGAGKGNSVREVIGTFERISEKKTFL